MTKRDWAGEFDALLKKEREAHRERMDALVRIHREQTNAALEESEDAYSKYDRAKEALDAFMQEYATFLRAQT